MKKLLLMALSILSIGALASCGSKTTTRKTTKNNTTSSTSARTTTVTTTTKKKETVTILTPNGTPLMAVAGLIDTEGIDIEAVGGAENLVAGLTTKSHDIIIAPLTAGAKTFVAGKSTYKLEAVVTTNNTYIISKEGTTLTNITDLKSKKLIAYGKNNTPDIALQNALKNNSMTSSDLEITYETDVTNATTNFVSTTDYDYCLIAEPQITQLKVSKGLNLNVLDLSKYMSSTIYQAGIFVNPDAKNQDRINEVIKDIEDNITYLNGNPTTYAEEIVTKNNSFLNKMGKEVLAQAIPNANISFIKAKDNKSNILAYFTEVSSYNPSAIGGSVTDEFFR